MDMSPPIHSASTKCYRCGVGFGYSQVEGKPADFTWHIPIFTLVRISNPFHVFNSYRRLEDAKRAAFYTMEWEKQGAYWVGTQTASLAGSIEEWRIYETFMIEKSEANGKTKTD